MPTINLIHEQREAYRRRVKASRAWFLAFLGTTAATGGITAFLLIASMALTGEANRLQAQAEELEPLRQQIAKNEDEFGKLRPRLATLNEARTETEKWTRILEHMSYVIPTNTWLTGVRSTPNSEEDAPIEFALTGMSNEQQTVGEFMLRLQALADLTNIRLRYSEEKKTQFGDGLEFQIVCDVPVPTSKSSSKESKNEDKRS
jgi:Tfp pilus assembly protein PilN